MADEMTAPSGKGFSKKLGPLPVWAWTSIGAGTAGVGYYFWRKRQESKTGSTSSQSSNTGTTTQALNGLEGQISDLYGAGSGYNQTSNPTSTTVSVPDVVGLPQEQAYTVLGDDGLKPAGSPTIKGKTLIVKTQSPKAGTVVPTGTPVILVSDVSGNQTIPGAPTGSPHPVIGAPVTIAGNVPVPNIVGKNIEDANAAVQAVGLKLSPVPKGVTGSSHIVVTQNPKAGAKAKKGATITDTYKTVKS
jgi:DNA-directed RNA polymerase subunit H (RpoH/RPB5)